MKKKLISMLVLCSLVVGLVFPIVMLKKENPTKAAESNVIYLNLQYMQDDARKMGDMINDYRVGNGEYAGNQTPLIYDYDLEKVAMQRAAELVVKCEDVRPDGQEYKQTLADFGFNIEPRGVLYGENYLFGTDDSMELEDAFNTLCTEEKNQKLMLGFYTAVGIAHVKVEKNDFWIQIFASRERNIEYTEPENGIRTMAVKVNPSNVNILSVDYVSGNLTVSAGSSVEAPVYIPTAKLIGSELQENIKLAPLSFESEDSFVVASDGMITGIKAGTGTIKASLLGKEYSYNITVTAGSGTVSPTPEPTKVPEPTPNVTPEPTPEPTKTPEVTQTPSNDGLKKGDTFKSDGLKYKVTSSGKVQVEGLVSNKTTKVTIPDTVKYEGKKYTVTSIKASAFAKNKNITKLIIGKNVKIIGKKAFYGCSELSSIEFRRTSVPKFGGNAFAKTGTKVTVNVPNAKLSDYKKALQKAGLNTKVSVK